MNVQGSARGDLEAEQSSSDRSFTYNIVAEMLSHELKQ